MVFEEPQSYSNGNVILVFSVVFPQTTVSTANVHMLPSVGMSVQVTLVYLVAVGQLPQFDAWILKITSWHPNTEMVHENVSVTDCSILVNA